MNINNSHIYKQLNNFIMKTKVILLAILGLVFIFSACEKYEFDVIPSTKITTTNFSASNITELDISDLFKVYVSFSETEESVLVEANENIHSMIEIGKTGNRLTFRLKKNSKISGTPVLNVYIKTATLSRVIANGAASVEFENLLESTLLNMKIKGAAKVSGRIETDHLNADLSGAAELEISGFSDSFDIEAEDASEMSGFDFATNRLNAGLSNGSVISLVVNDKLEISANGASKVYFKGSGIIEKQNLSDASEIIKMD